ncbi:MAG: hypothetical protein HUK03_05800 [Bacteroidaceae bacterium]|nr:hypothetical protein [Bacteroidaceae bacterium]
MIEFLLKSCLVTLLLLILIPMFLLLIGEGVLAGKVFDWITPESNTQTEYADMAGGASKVEFKDLTLKHNVKKDGEFCMKTNVEFTVNDMKGQHIYCSLNVTDMDGNTIVFTSPEGEEYTNNVSEILVESNSCTVTVNFFSPYKDFPLVDGRNQFLARVSIYNEDGNARMTSNHIRSFQLTP